MKLLLPLLSLIPLSLARTFYVATNQNVACLEVKSPSSSISLTKTIGTASGANPPVLIFNYNDRNLLPIPNFDYLVTDRKIDDYFNETGFLFPKGIIGTTYNDILVDTLEYNLTCPGTYCIYSPIVDGYEYRVEVQESSIFLDNVIFCVANILSNLFFTGFFGKQNKVIFRLISKFTFVKVVFYAISLVLSLRFNIIQYTEDLVSALDDVFTLLFLLGYGTVYANYENQNVKKIAIVTILTITPSMLSRLFDLKTNVTNIVINNRYYNVANGVMGSDKFDGLSVLQRVVRDVSIHRFSVLIALLFGLSKFVKFATYAYAIRDTSKQLVGGTKTSYIWSTILWLFVYPLASFGLYPDLVYNYYKVTDYAKVLAEFNVQLLRDRYWVLFLDELHWFLFYTIWFYGVRGLVVDDGDTTKAKKEQ
ncbi:hypothetical protein Cantr_01484 [Candida viswanathii]|uniref:Uncharacterized protein n=1 Tax=Candida viswanathii TaxID=5486 RepID=A0A367YJ67_9ASCO|nr:hypothetical protein Cantr_01484 [Candida viswanathii]